MNISIVNYDKESHEADIKFENDNHSLLTYCPFLKEKRLPSIVTIEAFLPYNHKKTIERECIIKNNDFYSYNLIGKIVSIKSNLAIVSVFGIEIKVDDVPSDINVDDNLSFEVKRLDCICG